MSDLMRTMSGRFQHIPQSNAKQDYASASPSSGGGGIRLGLIPRWVNKYNGEARFWLKYYATSKFPPKKVSTPSIFRETTEGIL